MLFTLISLMMAQQPPVQMLAETAEGDGPGVALFQSPTSDYKTQQNIPIGQQFEVRWKFTDALPDGVDIMTLEIEVPFTSPIQYIVVDDKIKKGTKSYKWKVAKDLAPLKGYRLLLRRSQNDDEERADTLRAQFGELVPSYSPRFTLFVSKDFSPDPNTQSISDASTALMCSWAYWGFQLL